MRALRLCATLAFLCLAGAAALYSQAVNGSLLGTITDSTGAVVPGASVTVTEANTGVSRSAITNESGNYVVPDLPPGTYTVSVEMKGFRKAVRTGNDVQVNTSVRVNLQLQPGEVTETVNVTAEGALLQTDRSDTGRKVESVQIENLPVPGGSQGHNFQNLIWLVPGVTKPFRPHSEFFNPQNSLSTQVNGQSRLGNNLQLEGVDDNERTGLLQVLIPPLEAIQNVDVTTSNYDAELGRSTGAVTNVILKSGTNNLHGEAYWLNQASALSSRPFYSPQRSHFVYNYVGGQIGGPIIKNRTFIFGDYLRIMDHRYNGNLFTLPTAAERAGDLSASTTTIYDPATGNPDGSGRQPFAGNRIPANRIDPISQKILSLAPLPNLSGLNNNYFELIPFVRTTDQFDVKVDHNQSDKDRFSFRYSFMRPVTFDGPAFGDAGGPHGGGFQGTGIQNTHSATVNYDRIFSPTLLSETRVGVNRYRNQATPYDYGKNDATALGIPGVNVAPFNSGQTEVDISGYSSPFIGYSNSMPWIRAETNILFTNIWTKTAGNHTIKWGFDMRRVRDDLLQDQTYGPRGRFSFGTAQTSIPGAATSFGNGMASFLLDVPSQLGRDLAGSFPAYRAWEFFSFVSDRWLVTPKLTLDYGVRWELYPPATPAHTQGFSNYDPVNNTLIVSGVGGNPDNLGLPMHWHDFAPRFGVAYRLTNKTVLRGGFGISFVPFPDNNYAYNFPVRQNNVFNPNNSFGAAILPDGTPVTFAKGLPTPAFYPVPSNGIITNPDVNSSYYVVSKYFREPYVESWNLAVQRQLPGNFSLDLAYVGNHGVDQPSQTNLNASTTLGADVAGQPEYAPFHRKASTTELFQGFSSSYNSLQAKVDRRFSHGFAMTTAFTFQKALGYQSEDGGITFYINGGRNWQVLSFNRKYTFVQSYVYELPFGKGKKFATSGPASWILGGWQLNGVLSIATGTPLNFGGNSASLRAPGNGNTLNHYGPIAVLKGNGRDKPWFNPTICSSGVTTGCFSQPGNLQFGNLGLDPIYGPGYWNLDGSLFRSFQFTERLKMELRAEAFSAVNTPQWGNPDTGIGNKTFGYITSAGGNRTMQLGAKIIF